MKREKIDQLIVKAEAITEKLHTTGLPLDYDVELALNEAVGRLTLSESEAVEILENFIESHSEYLNK